MIRFDYVKSVFFEILCLIKKLIKNCLFSLVYLLNYFIILDHWLKLLHLWYQIDQKIIIK